MKTETKIILPSDSEAAEFKTVQGWVGRDGRFYGKDERTARYAGSTHAVCEACGAVAPKGRVKCDPCGAKSAHERYLKLPFKEWDGLTPLCLFGDDQYFFDSYDIDEYCENNEVSAEELELVICEPNYYTQIDFDYWTDILPEDREVDEELVKKVDELNAFIEQLKPASWSEGRTRTEYRPAIVDRSGKPGAGGEDL